MKTGRLLGFAAAAVISAVSLAASAQENVTTEGADTCAVHRVMFDADAIPVLTRRDSENCKDSTEYSNLAEKIRFYTNFESGRLGKVMFSSMQTLCDSAADGKEVRHYTYDIFSTFDPLNPVDTSLAPSPRWFYFLMTGVKGKRITMNIKNSDPRAPMYSYDGENFERFDPYDESVVIKHEGWHREFITTKTFDKDSVYVAYCTPYTNSRLDKKLDEWRYREGVAIHSIGKSSQGRDMQMMLITNTLKDDKGKKRIYIHGRIHPSETPASWCLEGLIDELTGDTDYAKALRDNAIFYILPFINPDGVALGYSRCNANGVNMEINYNREDSLTQQEVRNVKNFIMTTTYGGANIDLFLNFHSQVANYATFWLHTAETTSKRFHKEEMTFSALSIDNNPYFERHCLSFSKIHPKYLEGYFWERFGEKTLATTWETPYDSYNKCDSIWVTTDNLKELGVRILEATGDYLGIANPERITVMPHRTKGFRKLRDTDHLYLGAKYYTAKRDNTVAKYKVRELPAGSYEIYGWVVGENRSVSEENENCWKFLSGHEQKKSGEFKFSLDKMKGEKVNTILILKKQL